MSNNIQAKGNSICGAVVNRYNLLLYIVIGGNNNDENAGRDLRPRCDLSFIAHYKIDINCSTQCKGAD